MPLLYFDCRATCRSRFLFVALLELQKLGVGPGLLCYRLQNPVAEMLQVSRLYCHCPASPLKWACSGTSSTTSTGNPFPGSHSISCLIKSFTSDSVENPANKIRRGAPRAQVKVQDQFTVAPDDGLKWWERDFGAVVRDLHSAQELTEAISAAGGKLIIVEFFASWCGSCRALYPKLCKLAAEHEDIVFCKINFDENKVLCKSLNIKVLPYFHFYRGTSEQLESFSCSITKLQKLKDAIAKYDAGGQHIKSKCSLEVVCVGILEILCCFCMTTLLIVWKPLLLVTL